MDDKTIEDLLVARATSTQAGPPPVAEMVAGARRSQRRRTTIALGGVLAAAVVVGSVALFGGGPSGRAPVAGGRTTSATPTNAAVPAGHQLVGVGDLGVVVPESWGMNETHCGTPLRDTVVIDGGARCLAAVQRPRGVESLEITEDEPFQLEAGSEEGELAGLPARLGELVCAPLSVKRMVVCQQPVYLPGEEIGLVATSSTQPEASARAAVTEVLAGVRVLDGQVGVPDYSRISVEAQGRGGEEYAERLVEVGLSAEIVARSMPGFTPGYVLDVAPGPGTVLDSGAAVRITVVAEPTGPAEEVRVGMSSDASDWDQEFDDPDVRADATVRVRVGDRIWSYADGNRSGTLAGVLDGNSLAVDGWEDGPNYPHSWIAVRPGRTTVTLTITADGEVLELGTVAVVVRE